MNLYGYYLFCFPNQILLKPSNPNPALNQSIQSWRSSVEATLLMFRSYAIVVMAKDKAAL